MTTMADTVLIATKRNFLIRALGFTAAGTALSVPIVTVADAKARMQHHIDGLQAAMAEYYGVQTVHIMTGFQNDELDDMENVRSGKAPGVVMLAAKCPGYTGRAR
jgi:hypothetical protein